MTPGTEPALSVRRQDGGRHGSLIRRPPCDSPRRARAHPPLGSGQTARGPGGEPQLAVDHRGETIDVHGNRLARPVRARSPPPARRAGTPRPPPCARGRLAGIGGMESVRNREGSVPALARPAPHARRGLCLPVPARRSRRASPALFARAVHVAEQIGAGRHRVVEAHPQLAAIRAAAIGRACGPWSTEAILAASTVAPGSASDGQGGATAR